MTTATVTAEVNRRAEKAGHAGEILGSVNIQKIVNHGDAIRADWTDCCGRWHHSTIKMAKFVETEIKFGVEVLTDAAKAKIARAVRFEMPSANVLDQADEIQRRIDFALP
jgi:hypothetical protein